jgi:hypothetical protein
MRNNTHATRPGYEAPNPLVASSISGRRHQAGTAVNMSSAEKRETARKVVQHLDAAHGRLHDLGELGMLTQIEAMTSELRQRYELHDGNDIEQPDAGERLAARTRRVVQARYRPI